MTHERLPFRRVPVTLVNEYASTISLSRHALPMLLDVVRVKLAGWRGEYVPAGAIPIEIAGSRLGEPLRTAA